MTSLVLNSLEIREFRAFKHLQIERLGRVNLIVGKNNVGKSSVLEALRLYAQRGNPALLWNLLRSRDESRISLQREGGVLEQLESIKHLFYGRNKELKSSIRIGPKDSEKQVLSILIDVVQQQLALFTPNQDMVDDLFPNDSIDNSDTLSYGIYITYGSDRRMYLLDKGGSLVGRKAELGIKSLFIPAEGLLKHQQGIFWDNIALTDLEDQVIQSLRIIAPDIERFAFISDGDRTTERTSERYPVVILSDSPSRIPLRSLGEGMNRMLGIALALINARDGILLVDEIESGLHYSVQADMWRLVFETARRLNIQVFATTHSWDCIQGFQEAAQEDQQSDGFLIRLGRKQENIVATVYNEEELAIATREQIEVR